jgi:hypothetical protein
MALTCSASASCDPTNKRNQLAHGRWWAFNPQKATIEVRGGIQRRNENQFGEYSEETILAIADHFETLEAELYKLRSEAENRLDRKHSFDWSSPP